MIGTLASILAGLVCLTLQDSPRPSASELNLGDLAAYQAALTGRSSRPGEIAAPVTFRELWEKPEQFQGRRVILNGRVHRRFRQGAFGTFPPLVELWVTSAAGDPFCLVFADPSTASDAPAPSTGTVPDAAPGSQIRFEGTFLRQIQYRGGDEPRLAPLIVGDRPPTVEVAAPQPVRIDGTSIWGGFDRIQWALGLASALVVAAVLGVLHLRKPFSRSWAGTTSPHTPPEFLDPESPVVQ